MASPSVAETTMKQLLVTPHTLATLRPTLGPRMPQTEVSIVIQVYVIIYTMTNVVHYLLVPLIVHVRRSFTKDGVTFSDREEYEAALTDTSHPDHNAANARATDAINRGEDRDSRTMLSALYHDQV
eukprot:9824-Heterococcus_DN1.PRE.1